LEERIMKPKTIEDLVDPEDDKSIEYQKLHRFLNQKLTELYEKEKATPLFDYLDIRYTAMIDLIYELMPSLKEELTVEHFEKTR
jgi:Ca2+-binding EF-hand superfamily protein